MNKDEFKDDDLTSSSDENLTAQPSYLWGNQIEFPTPVYVKKKMKKKVFFLSLAILLLILIFSFFYITNAVLGKNWILNHLSSDGNINFTIPVVQKPELDVQYFDKETGLYTAQGIGKLVKHSVVSIVCYSSGTAFTPTSQGSGIIMTEDGYILTNAHVISDATIGIKVILNNEDEYEAKIIGSDPKTDLAVIKIYAHNLTPITFGDSSELEIGEDIVAIGSPAGLYGSLTKGVVSGLDRMIKTDENQLEMNCIQIDAAINPGNSGGALVNMFGQLVGINSSKFASEIYDGIGFAISINAAKPIIEGLIADGYIKGRIRIGILFYQISKADAKLYDTVSGLYINAIDESCDIANTSLKVNDIITHINGIEVSDVDDIDPILVGKKPGDTLSATVYRINIAAEPTIFEVEFKLMEDVTSIIVDSKAE